MNKREHTVNNNFIRHSVCAYGYLCGTVQALSAGKPKKHSFRRSEK